MATMPASSATGGDWAAARTESGEGGPSFVVTRRLPLDQAPHGYEIFKHKQGECIKVVLKP